MRAALLLWLLCLPALTWSQGPAPRPGEHGQKEQGNPQGVKDTARETREREQKTASDEKLVTWTAVVALATVALGVFTAVNLILLLSQRGDLKEQRTLMQKQAGHLEEQATQLKATVEALERNAKRALRAYVAVNFSSIPGHSEVAHWTRWPITAICRITNTGQTPAYGVAWLFRIETHPPDFDPRTVLPLDPDTAEGPRSRPMIAAHSVEPAYAEGRQLTQEELEAIRADRMRLYFFGTVTYRDLFKFPRRSNFCVYMAVVGENAKATTTEYGNDTEYGDKNEE